MARPSILDFFGNKDSRANFPGFLGANSLFPKKSITNGDFFRWEYLWPRLADYFRLPVAPPLRLPLTQFMSDKEPLWRSMVQKHNLQNYSFQDAAAWPFGEAVFNIEYDVMSGTTKSRNFGFHEVGRTEEMLIRLMTEFQRQRFIPTP
jgi:hypothetical protein